jgi:indolepyruvate ferredoxin oxidoreductase beta subunit
MSRARIFLTGVGGQGTLTATTLLSRIGLDNGLQVTSGEIHGMAQRGGVVESTVLFGGFQSPKISFGEADLLLGFEPLETLRALPYLKPGGVIVSNSDPILPIGVTTGRESYPDLNEIRAKAEASCASRVLFVPCIDLAVREVGVAQAANMVLLGAACAAGAMPFTTDALLTGIEKYLKPALVEKNKIAVALGAKAIEKG